MLKIQSQILIPRTISSRGHGNQRLFQAKRSSREGMRCAKSREESSKNLCRRRERRKIRNFKMSLKTLKIF
jgi:hypothetical protein